jgi:DNA-binding transcriptional LysR family regulator
MEDFDIRKTDFHSLEVLVRIHAARSLTEAARELGLTQSTLSYTLSRMRRVFGDPLFVRQGRGVAPTERCDAVMPEIRILLERLTDLARPPEFNPATARERFVLSCNYYERAVIVPHLVRRLRAEAPGVRLQVITADTSGHRQLLERESDLLLSPMVGKAAGLMTRKLYSERYVCLLRADDVRRDALDIDAYRAADHLVINYETGWRPFYLPTLKALGIAIDPVIELPSFDSVRHLMKVDRFLITMPSGLWHEFEPDCVAVPAPFDVEFDIRMFWLARAHDAPKYRWLRGRVAAAAQDAAAQLPFLGAV